MDPLAAFDGLCVLARSESQIVQFQCMHAPAGARGLLPTACMSPDARKGVIACSGHSGKHPSTVDTP